MLLTHSSPRACRVKKCTDICMQIQIQKGLFTGTCTQIPKNTHPEHAQVKIVPAFTCKYRYKKGVFTDTTSLTTIVTYQYGLKRRKTDIARYWEEMKIIEDKSNHATAYRIFYQFGNIAQHNVVGWDEKKALQSRSTVCVSARIRNCRPFVHLKQRKLIRGLRSKNKTNKQQRLQRNIRKN